MKTAWPVRLSLSVRTPQQNPKNRPDAGGRVWEPRGRPWPLCALLLNMCVLQRFMTLMPSSAATECSPSTAVATASCRGSQVSVDTAKCEAKHDIYADALSSCNGFFICPGSCCQYYLITPSGRRPYATHSSYQLEGMAAWAVSASQLATAYTEVPAYAWPAPFDNLQTAKNSS